MSPRRQVLQKAVDASVRRKRLFDQVFDLDAAPRLLAGLVLRPLQLRPVAGFLLPPLEIERLLPLGRRHLRVGRRCSQRSEFALRIRKLLPNGITPLNSRLDCSLRTGGGLLLLAGYH
jgi:hypothetical protein